MATNALRLRWSWRDLRQRWVLVAVIALILSIGTGLYAAMGSTTTWRRVSNDASFSALHLHDLEAQLAAGDVVPQGALAAAVRTMPGADRLTAVDERLLWPVQVDASHGTRTVLVPGQLVGMPFPAGVDQTSVTHGNSGGALVELNFARANDLPATGSVRLSGGATLPYSGQAMQPEYFYVVGPQGGLSLDQGGFGALFVPLDQAQALAGQAGSVNDVVLTFAPGTDVATAKADLEKALAFALPNAAATVTAGTDEPAYQLLTRDAEGDQRTWDLVCGLVLFGASFAAFTLVSRIVEAQRREIGIGMALGVPPKSLAVRPLLVGAQIAILGAVGGMLVGLALVPPLRGFLDAALPLPVWRTPFQLSRFALAAGIGLVLPLVATALPVWRAVRVEPIEAIRTGRFATGRSGWARLASRLPFPRRATRQYPVRNLLRNPRRTVLTALAIAASITVMVSVLGLLDTFGRTLRTSDAELTRTAPDRLDVQLASFESVDGPTVRAVSAAPGAGAVSPALQVPAQLRRTTGGDAIDVQVTVLDMATSPWVPSVRSGDAPGAATGLLLSDKAAADLGVGPGDEVVLHHPQREGLGYRFVDTTVRVAGTHAVPTRFTVYADRSQAALFGLDGVTNLLQVEPAAGTSTAELQRAVFGIPGVALAQPVGATSRAFQDALAQYSGVLRVAEGFVLLLALLIAFNAATIGVDEKGREHATMFAFGVRPHRVLGMVVAESAAVGVLGTLVGAVAGAVLLRTMFMSQLASTLPDVGLTAYVAPTTFAAAIVLGVAAVALAPLFTMRKLVRTDVPATLRVVE